MLSVFLSLLGFSISPEIRDQLTTTKIAQISSPIQVQTSQIISFNQVQGRPEWQQNILNRISRSQWAFYPNGSFVYAQPDNSLSPVRGNFTVNQGIIYFGGSSSNQVGSVGSSRAEINGRFYRQGNTPMISMSWVSTSGTTANINGTPFYGGSSSSYQFTVSVR